MIKSFILNAYTHIITALAISEKIREGTELTEESSEKHQSNLDKDAWINNGNVKKACLIQNHSIKAS
jgi:hypothetical protein